WSFSVKKRWPVFQTRQFESSPSTQTSKKSLSRRSRMRIVRSVTLRTRLETTGVVGGSIRTAGSSSSNGKSNRSVIRQIQQFLLAIADSLDVDGAAGFLVGLDDDGVQPRIVGRGLESRGHAGSKTAESRR